MSLAEIREKGIPEPVTRGTIDRRVRIFNKVSGLQLTTPEASPIELMYYFRENYAPATALGYVSTMAAQFPEMKSCPGWRDHLKKLTLEAEKGAATQSNQAKFFTIEAFRKFLQCETSKMHVKMTIALLWLTASRHADIQWMEWIERSEKATKDGKFFLGITDMRGSKGDTAGTRGDQKAMIFPMEWRTWILFIVGKQKFFPSYDVIVRALKAFDVELSAHSCRRGACNTMGRLNISKIDAQALTLHQQQHRRESSAMDIYQTGMWLTDSRAKVQLRIQMILMFQSGLLTREDMLKLDQELTIRDTSLSAAMNLEWLEEKESWIQ